MKKCPECGNLCYDGAPKCGNCGAKFPKKGTSVKGSIFGDSKKKPPEKKQETKKKPVSKPIEITQFKKEDNTEPVKIQVKEEEDDNEPVIKPVIKPVEEKEEVETEKKTVKKVKNVKKVSNEESEEKSSLEIIKEEKTIIGTIIAITIIVICAIVLTSPGMNLDINLNNNQTASIDMINTSIDGFSFKYPSNWKEISNNLSSSTRKSITYQNDNGTNIQAYTTSNDANSLKEINKERLELALEDNSYVELVQTITIDEKNASNIILEDSTGNYTRYVTLFDNGTLYVFKINGESYNSVTSSDIEKTINTTQIS